MKRLIIYHIIVEGYSEENYLNNLNRFFREEKINYIIKTYNLRGLLQENKNPYNLVADKYSEAIKNKLKNEKIIIWIDNDLFQRKTLSKEKLQNRINKENNKHDVKYCFSYENFEDFFIMHFNKDIVNKWQNICKIKNHFKYPMKKKEYLPLFQQVIPLYTKENGIEDFEINDIVLNNLFENNIDKNIKFGCDLIKFIYEIVKNNT